MRGSQLISVHRRKTGKPDTPKIKVNILAVQLTSKRLASNSGFGFQQFAINRVGFRRVSFHRLRFFKIRISRNKILYRLARQTRMSPLKYIKSKVFYCFVKSPQHSLPALI